MQILLLVRKESGLAKIIRSLWSAIYWVSPTLEGIESVCWVYGSKGHVLGIRTKISWSGKYELEIEELERKVTGSDSAIVQEARSVETLPDHVGVDVRNVAPEMGATEQVDSLDVEAQADAEVQAQEQADSPDAEVIERDRKD